MSKRRQCKKCPWRKDVNPHDIPNGYCETKHANLSNTIAEPGALPVPGEAMHAMACHESTGGKEKHCIGWLDNQLNEGNNIALRLRVAFGHINANYELVGEQHATLEDTLPEPNNE